MKITIFTLFPEMVEPFFTSSIMKRAVEKGIITYNIVNFRDYAKGVHRKSDDEPFGGGAGMVLMPQPLLQKSVLIRLKHLQIPEDEYLHNLKIR